MQISKTIPYQLSPSSPRITPQSQYFQGKSTISPQSPLRSPCYLLTFKFKLIRKLTPKKEYASVKNRISSRIIRKKNKDMT